MFRVFWKMVTPWGLDYSSVSAVFRAEVDGENEAHGAAAPDQPLMARPRVLPSSGLLQWSWGKELAAEEPRSGLEAAAAPAEFAAPVLQLRWNASAGRLRYCSTALSS